MCPVGLRLKSPGNTGTFHCDTSFSTDHTLRTIFRNIRAKLHFLLAQVSCQAVGKMFLISVLVIPEICLSGECSVEQPWMLCLLMSLLVVWKNDAQQRFRLLNRLSWVSPMKSTKVWSWKTPKKNKKNVAPDKCFDSLSPSTALQRMIWSGLCRMSHPPARSHSREWLGVCSTIFRSQQPESWPLSWSRDDEVQERYHFALKNIPVQIYLGQKLSYLVVFPEVLGGDTQACENFVLFHSLQLLCQCESSFTHHCREWLFSLSHEILRPRGAQIPGRMRRPRLDLGESQPMLTLCKNIPARKNLDSHQIQAARPSIDHIWAIVFPKFWYLFFNQGQQILSCRRTSMKAPIPTGFGHCELFSKQFGEKSTNPEKSSEQPRAEWNAVSKRNQDLRCWGAMPTSNSRACMYVWEIKGLCRLDLPSSASGKIVFKATDLSTDSFLQSCQIEFDEIPYHHLLQTTPSPIHKSRPHVHKGSGKGQLLLAAWVWRKPKNCWFAHENGISSSGPLQTLANRRQHVGSFIGSWFQSCVLCRFIRSLVSRRNRFHHSFSFAPRLSRA